MPKLWKFTSRADPQAPKIESFQFLEAEELDVFEDEAPQVEELPNEADCPEEIAAPPEEKQEEADPVSYAQIQSKLILDDAKRQAEELLRQAEEEAQQQIEQTRQKAAEEGYQAGFQEGLQQGQVKALEEGAQAQEAAAQRMEDEVERFLKKAEAALERQLDDNLDDLRDLALAVAEKVICVSLKSSSDVIGRMIQTAVDKRRRREWVHIYIAECDARRLTTMPASLTAALSELSDRVRIIPMADDEAGTCIIECPDEIIDASAATQLQNIREMLSSRGASGFTTDLHFMDNGKA